jgi:hypothetical protein
VIVIRLRTPELIVANCRSAGTVFQVLQLSASPVITELNVKLAVRSKAKDAAVVIATRRLGVIALTRGIGRPRHRIETPAA